MKVTLGISLGRLFLTSGNGFLRIDSNYLKSLFCSSKLVSLL